MEKKKSVTHTARTIIVLWNVGLFSLVWMFYYNKYAFDTYNLQGGIVSILIYTIIYYAFCQVYKAFRIASYQIGETFFSQFISFCIPDLILYVECCLIYNHAINLIPGLFTVVLQAIGTLLLVIGFKNYLMRHVPPQKTMFIYGEAISKAEIEAFRNRLLLKYAHLFDVQRMVSEEEKEQILKNGIRECHCVLFYELSEKQRAVLVNFCLEEKKTIYLTPGLQDIIVRGCKPRHLLDTPLLKYEYADKKAEYGLKRALDILLSFVFLVLTSPILLITALAIKIEDRGPVFYKQERCTKDAKVFNILKFRSMIVDAEKNGFIPCVSGDGRITKVGKVIRSTRIDELPQILNILKGDMSFVGPRPERVEHVQKYTEELPEFAYRMRIKGGLTGYAQVFGKYNTSAYDKLRLDLMYIENQSILLDIKILMLTFKVVFKPESTEGFTEENSKNLSKEDVSAAENKQNVQNKNHKDLKIKARI